VLPAFALGGAKHVYIALLRQQKFEKANSSVTAGLEDAQQQEVVV
jgi:hypothetical protein